MAAASGIALLSGCAQPAYQMQQSENPYQKIARLQQESDDLVKEAAKSRALTLQYVCNEKGHRDEMTCHKAIAEMLPVIPVKNKDCLAKVEPAQMRLVFVKYAAESPEKLQGSSLDVLASLAREKFKCRAP